MKAHVEHDFIRNEVLVWVLVNRDKLVHLTPEGMRIDEPGGAHKDDVEPTLRLPYDVAEAIAPALLALAPPNTAQAEALADTRGVRDRLLTLVERLADPTPPPHRAEARPR